MPGESPPRRAVKAGFLFHLNRKNMFLVKLELSEQITEDSFRAVWKEKIFSEFTTLNEVKEWVMKTSGRSDKYKMNQVFLSEPES